MKINLNNYEEYALDYIENTISAENKVQFEQFLNKHPEIASEIFNLDIIVAPVPDEELINIKPLLREKEKSPIFRIVWFNSVAAALLILALFIFLYQKDNSPSNDIVLTDDKIETYSEENMIAQNVSKIQSEIKVEKSEISQTAGQTETTNKVLLGELDEREQVIVNNSKNKPNDKPIDYIENTVQERISDVDIAAVTEGEFTEKAKSDSDVISENNNIVSSPGNSINRVVIVAVDALVSYPMDPITNTAQNMTAIADIPLNTKKVNVSNKRDNSRFKIKLNLVDRLSDLANNQIKEAIMPEYLASNY